MGGELASQERNKGKDFLPREVPRAVRGHRFTFGNSCAKVTGVPHQRQHRGERT